MNKQKEKEKDIKRERRVKRIRACVSGTAKMPRLNVYRSLQFIYAQIIDDTTGRTLAAVHGKKAPKEKDAGDRTGKIAQSFLLGKELAKQAIDKNISEVVFDRSGFRYHGRVAAFAEGAREGGLKF